MRFEGPFDQIPLWALLPGTIVTIFAVIEAGYRFGRNRRKQVEDEKEGMVGGLIASTLALMGFILAFTFSLCVSWFSGRREIVVTEANAIGTAYLRASLLPDGRGENVRKLLRDYVDARLDVIQTHDIARVLERSDELQRELWREAEACGRDHPNSIVVGLFIQSLNETIDVHSRRVLVSLQSRLPLPLWLSLYAATFLTMAGVGYHEGLSRSRRSPAVIVLVLTFSVIFALIADLDRPQEGWLRTSQRAIVELRKSMERDS